jgi:hypothetical protein
LRITQFQLRHNPVGEACQQLTVNVIEDIEERQKQQEPDIPTAN